jgi:hypothetical protein
MAYINQPPDFRVLFAQLNERLSRLETAVRFTAPNVNLTTTPPANPRAGDIFFDTSNNTIKFFDGTSFIAL